MNMNMKNKYIRNLLVIGLTILSFGCDDKLDEKYYNPEKTTNANVPGFFTYMLNNDRVRPKYWNMRTFVLLHSSVYAQTAFYSNSNAKYQESTGYTEQYWDDFYSSGGNGSGVFGTYKAMEVAYNKMTDTQKAEVELFMNAGKVVLIDEASKMVDLWGDIPYSEAGSLITESVIKNAAFDDQTALYTQFIADLKDVNTFFSTATTDPTFKKYDIMLSGDVDKWRRYANSLRLRLLMRISYVDEGTAKTAVTEMLNAPTTYPLVDGSMNGNYSPASSDILLQPLTTETGNLNSAFNEGPCHYATDYMLNTVMLPASDPRIPVVYDKYGVTSGGTFTPNATYQAMPISYTTDQVENNYQKFAIIDSTTFMQNPQLPGIVMTASETNLLKAEAYERWSLGTAQTAYETALKQSVSFYYYLNGVNTTGLKKETKPDDTAISAFVANANVAYSGTQTEKLGKIWTQKWVHFGVMQSIQAWSEYRRTGYPKLTFSNATLVGYETPPTRLTYPDGERSYNSANYAKVQAKDTRLTKVFWDVKD